MYRKESDKKYDTFPNINGYALDSKIAVLFPMVDNEYQDIKILVYLKNRRAAACISNLDNSIESIVGEENKCAFSSLYCPFYDFNNDGKFSNEDATHLLFHVSFPDDYPLTSYGGSIADINHDGIIDDDDAIVVSNYYSGISNGDNTISYSNPC